MKFKDWNQARKNLRRLRKKLAEIDDYFTTITMAGPENSRPWELAVSTETTNKMDEYDRIPPAEIPGGYKDQQSVKQNREAAFKLVLQGKRCLERHG